MKILLISPAADHLRVTRFNSVPRRKMLRFSVLPLTAVAALTPSEHEVQICDENVEPIPWDSDADIVGISFMTAYAPRAYAIAAEFKRRGKLTVAGGYHATLVPDEVSMNFDAVVVGDAEELWPRVIADAAAARLQKFYRHESPVDLSTVPVPRRDLTKKTTRYYATTDAVQVGRGCRHQCRYCSVTTFHNHTYRVRPIENVLEELRHIGRDFLFVDDNIITDRDYAGRLFAAMVPMKKRWVSQCSIELADDPALLMQAKQAGCIGLFIGLESLSRANLEAMNKGFNAQSDLATRLNRIHAAGISVTAGVIVGLDNDDCSVFEKTLEFLLKNHVEAVQVNILTPLPGTPLFKDFERDGRITDRDWSHYTFRRVVMSPARMSATELQGGADWLYRKFYRFDHVLRRCWHTAWHSGLHSAWLCFRLNQTYRYDIKHEHIQGCNPANVTASAASTFASAPPLKIAAAACLAAYIGFGCAQLRLPPPIKENHFGESSTELRGDLPIVHLAGDGVLMGRQFGALCGVQANRLLTLLKNSPDFQTSAGAVVQAEKELSAEHLAEIETMAKGAGISRESAIAANVALDSYCTVLVTGADGRGPVRIARNMDFFPAGVLGPATAVVVRKSAGCHTFSAVSWPGYSGVISGMNDTGLTVAILKNNAVQESEMTGTPIAFRAREVLEKAGNVEEGAKLFAARSVGSNHFLLLADPAHACIVWQDAYGKVHRRDPSDGWLAWSNGEPDTAGQQHESRALRLAAAISAAPENVTDDWLKSQIVAVRLQTINAQVMLFKPQERSLDLARAKPWRTAGLQPWVHVVWPVCEGAQ